MQSDGNKKQLLLEKHDIVWYNRKKPEKRGKMNYIYTYKTPVGFDDMLLGSDGAFLTALCFEHSRDVRKIEHGEPKDLAIFEQTVRWLDIYFSGKQPDFTPAYKIDATPFRQAVIERMLRIPYGQTVTYGSIAAELAAERGLARMSAQAVGGAVGFNPICLIVPCHRVVGASGSLTGYGGGIRNKIALLKLEGCDMTAFTVPKKGTALCFE